MREVHGRVQMTLPRVSHCPVSKKRFLRFLNSLLNKPLDTLETGAEHTSEMVVQNHLAAYSGNNMLSNEVWLHVFVEMDLTTLATCRLSHRRWEKLIGLPWLWHQRCLRDFPTFFWTSKCMTVSPIPHSVQLDVLGAACIKTDGHPLLGKRLLPITERGDRTNLKFMPYSC